MFVTPIAPHACGGHVKVYVRTRPLLQQEEEQGARSILAVCAANKEVVVDDAHDRPYKFEEVFEESCTQEIVFRKAVAPLVTKVKEGHNATIFAYGQTGSGKTFTMGTNPCSAKEDEGILQRALHTLLDVSETSQPSQDLELRSSQCVTVSFIEIYNKKLFDLLTPTRVPLKTKLGLGGAVSPVAMVEKNVKSIEEGLVLLEKGNSLRSVGATAMNQHSSRSHALIYLTLKNENHCGCLKLVDLAGAESVGRAQTSKLQFEEGVNINKDLLALGKVLSALSNSADSFASYRESILTGVLKDSLTGSSQTALIACVNPASFNTHETINTLRFAEQARNIRMKPQVFSSVKHGLKRRFDCLSATPLPQRGTLSSLKKTKHNNTVCTPVHKKAARPLFTPLNATINTPSISHKEILNNSLRAGWDMPPPTSMFSTLKPTIFEDDSPSRFSTVSAINDTEAHSSMLGPVSEPMTNHWEKYVSIYQENFEDRIVDKLISKLSRKKISSKSKKINKYKKSQSSTPTDAEDGKSSDISDDNILVTSIAHAFLNNPELQDHLSIAIKKDIKEDQQRRSTCYSALPVNQPVTKTFQDKENNQKRQPLGNITNAQESKTSYLKENIGLSRIANKTFSYDTNQTLVMDRVNEELYSLPVTSTALRDNRHARKSTRLSTKQSINSAMLRKVSLKSDSSRSSSLFFDIERNGTNSLNCESISSTANISNNDSSPVLRFPKLRIEPHSRNDGNKSKENVELRTSDNTLVQIEKSLGQEKSQMRRSSRRSAIKATQLNFEILNGESPVTNMNKTRRSSLATTKKYKGNKSVLADKTMENWVLTVSPRLQQKHNSEVLDILNTGTLMRLQQLPTVGPKTAMVIHNFRELCGPFSSFEELQNVPGLSCGQYTRFMKANLVTHSSS
ncbi:hypothetical protein OTU49_003223 [Cherax quadricarinatus]|uniref:Kinesin motor domain-containing protein n=2 Tax=Cherax quadricarinatus TaxID=27406 RepID=A0AAW0XJZ6_CHEQU